MQSMDFGSQLRGFNPFMAASSLPNDKYFSWHQHQFLRQEASLNPSIGLANSSFLIENLLGLNHHQSLSHHLNRHQNPLTVSTSNSNETSPSSSSETCSVSSTSFLNRSLPDTQKYTNKRFLNALRQHRIQDHSMGHPRSLKRPRMESTVASTKVALKKECLESVKSSSSITSSSLSSKSKRIRTIFTQDQLDKLEVEFEKSQYMVGAERDELAKLLFLSPNQVKVWFQNRRIKFRKQHHEENQKKLAASRMPSFSSNHLIQESISVTNSSTHGSEIDSGEDYTNLHDDDTLSPHNNIQRFFI